MEGESDRVHQQLDDTGLKPPDRRGAERQPEDARRRRGGERRFAGWGDGVERLACARNAAHPAAGFPVESRTGSAVIPLTVVARRTDAILLCTFDHAGDHMWPDGEAVSADR